MALKKVTFLGTPQPEKERMGQFITKVTPFVNYLEPTVIEQVYKGILRTIVNELRTKGAITLPDFGSYRVIKHKERKMRNPQTGEMISVPAKNTVKFTPGKDLQFYFYNYKEPMVK